MVAPKPDLPGLLNRFRVTNLVTWCFEAIAVFGLAQLVPAAAAAADYDDQIRPLVKTYCLGCHSTKTKKGGLDMERFATLQQVRADVEPWQSMLEMLESDEMPPKGKPRPRAEERRLMIGWIRGLLEREARRRSGDPGPVLVRRLNNAEYR